MKMPSLVKTVKVMGMCLVMAAFMCSFAIAEDKPSDDTQILIEKIKADKKLLVAENMQLSEAEAKKFWPIYDQFQNELFILRMRSLKLIENYAENYKSMSFSERMRKINSSF